MFNITDGFARCLPIANPSQDHRQSECQAGGMKNKQIRRFFVMIERFSAAIQWQVDKESGRRGFLQEAAPAIVRLPWHDALKALACATSTRGGRCRFID